MKTLLVALSLTTAAHAGTIQYTGYWHTFDRRTEMEFRATYDSETYESLSSELRLKGLALPNCPGSRDAITITGFDVDWARPDSPGSGWFRFGDVVEASRHLKQLTIYSDIDGSGSLLWWHHGTDDTDFACRNWSAEFDLAGDVSYAVVPEPAALVGLILAGPLAFPARRVRTRKAG